MAANPVIQPLQTALFEICIECGEAGCDRSKGKHRLAEVGLGMAGRVGQRHEHLLRLGTMLAHIVLHARIAAGIAVLGAQALEDALGRVPPLRQR